MLAHAHSPEHTQPRWHSGAHRHRQMPAHLRPWLLDHGSLTAKLQALSQGHFRVEILRQSRGYPLLSEQKLLGMAPRRLAVIREVVLYGNNEPWVFARSVLPLASLTGPLRRLRHLDNQPLGALLFSQPNLVRGPIEISAMGPGQGYVPTALQGQEPLWGRRSVFWLYQRPLMVSEVFLDAFTRRIQDQ
ncbi:chorismate--pyruvate lyase family protein [Marinimicrobium alkaliphilum]|uniref:chorismate--pyruvate lyase family protein n=1 Tax=Marinimicrobium alkaliphilum TaxID=2202654 RepID=UPI000DBA58A9|nr:chorismate lyase [Marinimicrobium alkaliphilum]